METIKELTKLSNGKELDIVYPIRLYDKDCNEAYFESSNGDWYKIEYKDGNDVYFENSNGYWYKSEYEEGNEVYFEDSSGYIDDNREPVNMTIEEVCKLAGRKVRIVE